MVFEQKDVSSGGCRICGDLSCDEAESGLARAYGAKALFDATILRTERYAIFVPVAPLLLDYLVIVPVKHSTVPILPLSDLQFESLLQAALQQLELAHGYAWAFEHTGKSADGPSCVEHSHVHVLPGFPPTELLRQPPAPINDASVVVRTLRGEAGFSVPRRQKQYVRRLLAEELGIGEFWDWKVYRHHQIYIESEKRFVGMARRLETLEPR